MKRDPFTAFLPLRDELIIDNFAGGGGTSVGLEAAFGRPVDIAINHDPEALAMHAMNHPRTLHLCQSVWDVNPIEVTGNQPVALVWLSPDCKHFSKAKGGMPVSKHIRGLAWIGMRWVALCKPRALILENVEEFQTWGPLIIDEEGNARPCPKRKGRTFESFVRQLRSHGYQVEWRELRACDHGAPTIRKRLFLIARRDGIPITWPKASNGAPTSKEVLAGKLAAWRTAADCIDWSIEGASIFGRRRELAANTQRRVAKGMWRHVLATASPFIVGVGGRMGQSPARSVSQPVQTITAKADSCIVQPVVAPLLAPMRGTSEGHMGGHEARAPLSTVCAGGTHHALVQGCLVMTNTTGHPGAGPDKPLAAVTTGGHHALAAAHLITIGYGERAGQAARAQVASRPLGTVVGANKHAVVMACVEQANGGFYEGNSGRPVDAPLSTITTAGSNQRLVTAYCIKYYSSGGQWQGLADPMHTLPTKARMGLVEAIKVPIESLAPEHRDRARQCAEFLRTHLPEHFTEPADMVLMSWAGQWWVLVDITLRMLKPRELFRAQGFPDGYVIEEIPDPALLFADGRQAADPLSIPRIPLSAAAQVRMCGNAVCPPLAEALASANFVHELAWKETT